MHSLRKAPNEVRVRARLEVNHIPVPEAGCWLWTGPVNEDGYGQTWDGVRYLGAHRASYALHIGPIPKGKEVCHKCDTRSCINPDHLFLGTHGENMRDMYRKGRRTQCGERNGHARLTEAQVSEIKRSGHVPRKVLAANYGVSVSLIGMIRGGYLWKEVA